jgi:hypothetical protein
MRIYKTKRCKIRPELFEQNLDIPIWRNNITRYIHGLMNIEYRWITETRMQIKRSRQWWDAEPIDFEFIN